MPDRAGLAIRVHDDQTRTNLYANSIDKDAGCMQHTNMLLLVIREAAAIPGVCQS